MPHACSGIRFSLLATVCGPRPCRACGYVARVRCFAWQAIVSGSISRSGMTTRKAGIRQPEFKAAESRLAHRRASRRPRRAGGGDARRWASRDSAALNSGCLIPAFLVVMPERLHAPGNDCLPSKTAHPGDITASPAWPRPTDCGQEREPYTRACMRHRAAIYRRSLEEFL